MSSSSYTCVLVLKVILLFSLINFTPLFKYYKTWIWKETIRSILAKRNGPWTFDKYNLCICFICGSFYLFHMWKFLYVSYVEVFICFICGSLYLFHMWKFLSVSYVEVFICFICGSFYMFHMWKFLYVSYVEVFYMFHMWKFLYVSYVEVFMYSYLNSVIFWIINAY